MKIKEINSEHILFDNEMKIEFDHVQDCCEYNYADFEQLSDQQVIGIVEFDEKTMEFEKVEYSGFRFGSKGTQMYFVPCYSEQNGYYSSDVEIYFNNQKVLEVYGEFIQR